MKDALSARLKLQITLRYLASVETHLLLYKQGIYYYKTEIKIVTGGTKSWNYLTLFFYACYHFTCTPVHVYTCMFILGGAPVATCAITNMHV